jgi:hypothetical protein
MAKMFRVSSLSAACHGEGLVWNLERGTGKNVLHNGFPLRPDRIEIRADAGIYHVPFNLIDREHLARKTPQLVQCLLCAHVTFLSAITEANDPLARMPDVIAYFLVPLGRDSGQFRIRALLKLLEHVIAECVEKKLPDDREGIIAFRELNDLEVPEVDAFAEIRE